MDCGWLLVGCHLYLGNFYGDFFLIIKTIYDFCDKFVVKKKDMYDDLGILNYGRKYQYLKLDTALETKL